LVKDAEPRDAETPTQKPLQAALGVLAVAAAVALFYYGRIFFVTVIIASIIAFLLDPVVELFTKMRIPRGVASFLVCSIALMAVYLAGLGLYTESVSIANDLPSYGERINEIVEGAAARIDSFEKGVYQSVVPKRFQDGGTAPADPNAARNRRTPAIGAARGTPAQPPEVRVRPEPVSLMSLAYQSLSSIFPIILMGCFVPFLVYFLLSWRDHLRWRFLQLFEGENRETADRAWAGVSHMVRAYVIGNFLLGVILAIASSILFASVKLPYWVVIGPVSGFLSLVPYIGLPLAALPPLVAALPATRDPAVYLFLGVSTSLLHLFAMNLLYPKMIGSRVHLNPLAATLSLMLWGTLWGGIGLLLGIPMTAALKAVCDNVDRLKPYGRLLGD
jgi:predicted PurR-regulated permease PerM